MMDEQWRGEPGAHREASTVELFPEPPSPAEDESPDDGLSAQLAAAAPRRWWSRTTVYLAGAALLVAGFLGGVQVQKSYGSTPTSGGAGNFPPVAGGYFPRQNGAGQGQQGGASGAARGGTSGTIKLVDGGTVYVQTATGDVITIKTNGGTKVAVAKAGALKDLKAGDAVTVQGSTAADGTVTATTVTATPK